MHIIKEKQYEPEEEKGTVKFYSLNSRGTLSIVLVDGTHINLRGDELHKLKRFLNGVNEDFIKKMYRESI